jgi:hypothetical protein
MELLMDIAVTIALGCAAFVVGMGFVLQLTRPDSRSSSVNLEDNDFALLSKYVSSDSRDLAHISSRPAPAEDRGDRAAIAERARVDRIVRALASEVSAPKG